MREMNSIFRSWRISFSPAVAKITWCSIGCLGLVCWLKSVKLQKWKMPELYYCTCFKDLNKYNPTILWTHNFCGSSSCQWPPFQVRGLRRQRSFGAFFHCAARLPRPLAQTFQGANGGGLWLQGEQLWEGGVCLLWFHFGDNIYIYIIYDYIYLYIRFILDSIIASLEWVLQKQQEHSSHDIVLLCHSLNLSSDGQTCHPVIEECLWSPRGT